MRQNRCHAMQSQLYQLSTTQCLQLKAIYKMTQKDRMTCVRSTSADRPLINACG